MITRAITGLVLLFSAWRVFAQSPALNYATPSAVAPGKTTTVTFHGENLSGATELWTSFLSKVTPDSSNETNGPARKRVVFRLSIPKTVPVGIGAMQLAATNGVSDLHLLMIDDLPTVTKSGTIKTIASAQRLKLPVAVDGRGDELSFDYYQFNAKKGQRVSIEVVANRLGSPFDPVVRLLDSGGKELVYCDDDPAIGPDARFSFIAPAAGSYFIEVRDLAYQGGPKHRYRLRVGNFPLAGAPFPAGARQGAQTQVQFVGRNVEGVRPVSLRVPEHARHVPLAVKFPGGRGSGFVTLTASSLPESMETEPNDTPETATKISVPATVNGRFGREKDRDWFEFHAEKGQRLVLAGRTRSLGSPCDLSVLLFDSEGKQLGEGDIAGANEGTLTNSFNQAGTYRLLVEELNRQGGPELAYRIAIEPFQPGFALSVDTNRVESGPGGELEIKVTAVRREYDGPITLSAEGLGDGFAVTNNVIAEKKNETTLKLTLPGCAATGQLFHFTIAGKARLGDSDFETTASTMPALRKLFPLLRYPPPELDGEISIGVKASAPKAEREKGP